ELFAGVDGRTEGAIRIVGAVCLSHGALRNLCRVGHAVGDSGAPGDYLDGHAAAGSWSVNGGAGRRSAGEYGTALAENRPVLCPAFDEVFVGGPFPGDQARVAAANVVGRTRHHAAVRTGLRAGASASRHVVVSLPQPETRLV